MSEFSEGVETRRHEPSSGPAAGYLPYDERKPYVVADVLTALSGPTRGVVTLPHHLDCYTADYNGTLRPDSEIEEIVWLTHADRHRVSPVDRNIFDRLHETAHLR